MVLMAERTVQAHLTVSSVALVRQVFVRDLPDDNDLSASNFLLKFLPILVFQV
jgi:hypothetical protein